MPYYDTLGRYINPFYLDVHPDVRAELEMRAALVASDFRSANTKSIEWPYQKMPWAHIVSVDFPNIKLGFEKEKFDDRNSDESGSLLLYGKNRNEPKIPLLTGVEISNMGQRGSLLKGKFTFTYFPNLTINGFDLEELQGAFFTPGREVQISFGWSVYAENPWVNKLEFKGLIYGFNWSVQPNLSIVADVEVVSATTLALGLSGDQSVLESPETDIVKVEGWDTELKGLNLLTVMDKDLSVITKEVEIGRFDYVDIKDTTEKLFDYYAIGLPTSEFEEVQNIVINDYNYDPNNWEGGGTPYGEGEQTEAQQQPQDELLEKIKNLGENFYDEIWNWFGLNYWTDPDSEWNQARTWQDRWNIIKKFSNNPWMKTAIGGSALALYPATKVPLYFYDSDESNQYTEYRKLDFGALKYDDTNKSRTINLDYRSIANNDQLQVIESYRITGIDVDAFKIGKVINNTKKKIDQRGSNEPPFTRDFFIKPNAANIPAEDGVSTRYDRIPVTFKPTRAGMHYATLEITVFKYRKNPLGENRYFDSVESKLIRTITLTGEGLTFIAKDENNKRDAIDFNFDYTNADGKSPKVLKKDNTETFEAWTYYGLDNEEYVQFKNTTLIPNSPNAHSDPNAVKIIESMPADSSLNPNYKGKKTVKVSKKGCVQPAHYIKFEFTPKLEGPYSWLLRTEGHRWVCGTRTKIGREYVMQINLLADVGQVNPRTPQDADIKKEYKEPTVSFDKAKSDIQETLTQRELELTSTTDPITSTENPTDTETTTEEPVSATNESQVKVTTIPKTFWYVRLGALVEFANKLLERFETDPKNKNFARMLFRIQAYNNEAEYNTYVKSSYPIDVFFPDNQMGRYGGFCPFYADGPAPTGHQLLRTFGRGRDKNGNNKYVLEDDVINIGQILVGTEIIRSTYESFLEEGGKNIALKNITKFFDEILKIISTATGEIYQFTAILFEEPEKLIPRSEYRAAEENTRLRGGSRIELVDIFNYNATEKRSKAIVSLEDTNLASKVIREGAVEPYKFDATVIRPMLRNVQVVSKPSKEMAAAAYIAARGQNAKSQGGDGQGIQNLEVTLNLRGFQNEKEYRAELTKTQDQLKKDLDALAKSGWNSAWSELIRGNLIKLKRLTLDPHDVGKGLGTSWLNRAIYPIEFSLTLDGINGFKFGDVIQTSLIPKHYNEQWGIVFTVLKITHKVTLSSWETSINTVARLNATGNYAAKVETPYR